MAGSARWLNQASGSAHAAFGTRSSPSREVSGSKGDLDESLAREQRRFSRVDPEHVEGRVAALHPHPGGLVRGPEPHRDEVGARRRLERSGEVVLEVGDAARWHRDHQVVAGGSATPERQARRQ